MPTIKTIKPDGTGDYTTLSAWEDVADDAITADQWAECYSGGDLGAVLVSGWAALGDENNFPNIYAAPGHETTNFTTGAFASGTGTVIQLGIAFIKFTGIRVTGTRDTCNNAGNGILHCSSSDTSLIANCVVDAYGAFGAGISRRIAGVTGTHTVKNCLVRSDEYKAFEKSTAGGDGVLDGCIFIGGTAVVMACDFLRPACAGSTTGLGTTPFTVKNCVAINPDGGPCYAQTSLGEITFTVSNNASNDDTADSYLGGADNQNNVVPSDCFTDFENDDYTSKRTGVFYRNGIATTNINSLNGVARHNPPDIGAYELPLLPAVVPSTFAEALQSYGGRFGRMANRF